MKKEKEQNKKIPPRSYLYAQMKSISKPCTNPSKT